ncbi:MAG: hypothetical protein N3A54_06250, partial [Patescibacteria group bacterium]|nr:hypothetical protein [Patescibacteria group bacterium]
RGLGDVYKRQGYRCRTFDHFLWATKNIHLIDPYKVREWAIQNFSCDKVLLMYEEFWKMVMNVYTGNGWYELHPERNNLDWLKKEYSMFFK